MHFHTDSILYLERYNESINPSEFHFNISFVITIISFISWKVELKDVNLKWMDALQPSGRVNQSGGWTFIDKRGAVIDTEIDMSLSGSPVWNTKPAAAAAASSTSWSQPVVVAHHEVKVIKLECVGVTLHSLVQKLDRRAIATHRLTARLGDDYHLMIPPPLPLSLTPSLSLSSSLVYIGKGAILFLSFFDWYFHIESFIAHLTVKTTKVNGERERRPLWSSPSWLPPHLLFV